MNTNPIIRTIRTTLLSLVIIAISVVDTYAQSARKYGKAAHEFTKNGNYQEALLQYNNAIELTPNDADFYFLRGACLNQLKRYNDALKDFERGLTFDPNNDEYYYELGYSYYYIKEYKKALTYLHKASNEDKRDARPYAIKVDAYLALKMYDFAKSSSDTALSLDKRNANFHYQRGLVHDYLNNENEARLSYQTAIEINPFYVEAQINLAKSLLKSGENAEALKQMNTAINHDKKCVECYNVRSQIHTSELDYPEAINDISRNIMLEPDSAKHYVVRGGYYYDFKQYGNAITDYTKAISMDKTNADAYFGRGQAYEGSLKYELAAADYAMITSLSKYDMRAQQMLDEANARMYEIHRETDAPVLKFVTPYSNGDTLQIAGDARKLILTGKIQDKSQLESFKINNEAIHYEGEAGLFEFMATVNIEALDSLVVTITDVYKNVSETTYSLKRMETDAPEIFILAPYASDTYEIYLESNNTNVFIQGSLRDESLIKRIFIDGVTASYKLDELNPTFTATVSIANKTSITVEVEDVYGNKNAIDYTLNRDGANLSASNPMGKTWVVFIENSDYDVFASLEGPVKDITLIQKALIDYEVHNVIHKKNMSKNAMDKFFSIELRDLVKTNQVKSLLIWYAGHGKFINNVGYWVPKDAKRDDEFTYFNINALKSSMQAYNENLVHTLVVTDACESGPTFYSAMRDSKEIPSCGDWKATQFKSSQVFSSAGYELAVDNSQFTRTFANSLINNPDDCIPIESIVQKVSMAVKNTNQQTPLFGKINGLQDENGSFFFISKPNEQ